MNTADDTSARGRAIRLGDVRLIAQQTSKLGATERFMKSAPPIPVDR